jgi:hypothetical protein
MTRGGDAGGDAAAASRPASGRDRPPRLHRQLQRGDGYCRLVLYAGFIPLSREGHGPGWVGGRQRRRHGAQTARRHGADGAPSRCRPRRRGPDCACRHHPRPPRAKAVGPGPFKKFRIPFKFFADSTRRPENAATAARHALARTASKPARAGPGVAPFLRDSARTENRIFLRGRQLVTVASD